MNSVADEVAGYRNEQRMLPVRVHAEEGRDFGPSLTPFPESTMWDPDLDGAYHLNVYSKAKTELGRWMSNFAHQPMNVPGDGAFNSVEGYWYWIGCQHERLRQLSGYEAKKFGKACPAVLPALLEEEFQAKIRAAIVAKAYVRPDMLAQLRASTLPLAHYYVFGTTVRDAGYQWILDIWNDIRAGGLAL